MDNLQQHLDSLEAELEHWEGQLGPEKEARDETNTRATATLDALTPKLKRAKRALAELKAAPPEEQEACLAELEEDLEDVRDTFKRLDAKAHTEGPALS